MSQRTTKHTLRLVRPAETQISLRIRAVWSERLCWSYVPPGYPKRYKLNPLKYWLDVQADLSLCWSHGSYCRITKTCLFKYTEKITTKKWKFSDKNFRYFSYFCSKHRLWVLVRTASPRRFLQVPTNYVFEQK